MMRAVLIGPLPAPTNGCSYANSVLASRSIRVEFGCIDTSTGDVSSKQGARFSTRKAFRFLRVYLSLPSVAKAGVVYLTPGQTFFGLMKYAPFMVIALLLRVPYVVHVHGNHFGSHYASLRGIRRLLFRSVVGHAAAGIVLSDSLRANFEGLLPSERVHVVENFAGNDAFLSECKAADRLRVLYLSNLMREKGILDVLDSLAMLTERGVDFEATIAGQIDREIESEVLEKLALLGERVRFLGVVSGQRKVDALACANVLVLPTYYPMEGQPIALLEALASGNIVITTRHAGITDVIDESNGYFVEAHAPNEIADRLESISSELVAAVTRFSCHNVRHAKSRFTEEKFVSGVERVLEYAMRGREPVQVGPA